ncbi:LGFP repeat-containing protein [Cytobacillus oceanisediminis]
MFYDGYPDKGKCPAGGGHQAIGYNFVLPHDVPGTPTAQTDWRYCGKCHAMFYDGYPDKGKCPAGGGHQAIGYNFVLPHDPAPPVAIQPFPGDIIVTTPIERKYQELLKKGFKGTPVSAEHTVTDGVGRARAYNNGMGFWSIWWHPETGAHEVHGAIHEKWFSLGYHLFGYPITDELTTPDGRGRYNHFRDVNSPNKPEKSIYWTPQTGAHAVQGKIRDKWAEIGWEKSPIGYPISDEKSYSGPGGKYQIFENGEIYLDYYGAQVKIGPPATGSVSTPSGPTPSPTPPPTAGYSSVSIYNCHTDRRSIIIWVNDGSGLQPVTTLNHQYNDYGTCPAGEPHVLELKNGVWNHVVCVDVGAIGCGINDPTQAACRRYEFSLLGNSGGPQFPTPVIVN